MSYLAHLLGQVLQVIYNIVGNYGTAIILFTLVIKLLMVPLALRQTKSMAGVQSLQPEIKSLQEQYKKPLNEVNLLYLDSSKQFIYREELDEASRHSYISINYLTNREDISREISSFASNHLNEAEYFIVGSKSMISSIRQMLKQSEIKKRNIKIDAFVGY